MFVSLVLTSDFDLSGSLSLCGGAHMSAAAAMHATHFQQSSPSSTCYKM